MTVSPLAKWRSLSRRAICSLCLRSMSAKNRTRCNAATGSRGGGPGGAGLAARLPGGDGAALQEVERAVLERPFDVATRPVGLLALQGELGQGRELRVVEADLVDLREGHLLLEGAPVRERANRDALASGLALQHLARAVEAEVVRDDEAGDHRFAEAPARLDQALVGAGDRVFGEHDASDAGVEERLHDDTDARASEQADTLAIGDGRVGVRGPPDIAHCAGNVGRRMDIEHGEVLAGEARSLAVFVDSGRPDGERRRQRGDGLRQLLDGLGLTRGDGLDQVTRERHAGRDREAMARSLAEARRPSTHRAMSRAPS